MQRWTLLAAWLAVGCSPVVVEDVGTARSAATCQRNCPEPPGPEPEERRTYAYRDAVALGARHGVSEYRKPDAATNTIQLFRGGQQLGAVVVERPAAQGANPPHIYTAEWQGRSVRVYRRLDVLQIVANEGTPSERSARFQQGRTGWTLLSGDASVARDYAPQLNVLGSTIDEIGEAYLQSLVGNTLPESSLTEPGAEARPEPQTGCYDKGGFCSAQFQVCKKCGADGEGAPGGENGGGGAELAARCNGRVVTGNAIDWSRTVTRAFAREHADGMCRSEAKHFISEKDPMRPACMGGCCAFLQSDGKWGPSPDFSCACVPDTDFACFCEVYGRACSTEQP